MSMPRFIRVACIELIEPGIPVTCTNLKPSTRPSATIRPCLATRCGTFAPGRSGSNGSPPSAAAPGIPGSTCYETPARYVVTAEVPGLAREQIDLAVQDNRLTIRGVRPPAAPETASRHYHQVERGHGSFQRTFEFLDAVDQDGITADLRDGVLTVTLPKIATPPRRIDVQ